MNDNLLKEIDKRRGKVNKILFKLNENNKFTKYSQKIINYLLKNRNKII